ncbi:MAG: hypothetical protein WCP57_04950 [Bacteroidota bacterium]
MIKNIFLFCFCFFVVESIFAQDYEGNKVVIDQGKIYTVVSSNRNIILEIRNLDSNSNVITYKLVPVRKMEDGRDLVWDIKDGYFYTINLMEQANMELSETLKKIKISDMISDLNYKLTTADFMANTYISNKPFLDVYAQEVKTNELVFDISITDKLYVYVSNKNTTATYTASEAGDWEKIEVNPSNLTHIIGYNHMYYNNEMIIAQYDCNECKKTKAIIEVKKYPLMLINKDTKAIAALSHLPNVEDENKIIISIFIQKNSSNYEFK